MVKSLTLNQTWSRCIAMWRWIVEQLKIRPEASVDSLKREWLRVHDPVRDLSGNCYFCAWVCAHKNEDNTCVNCPGVQIDPQFSCESTAYHYIYNPAAFLRKLEQLNKKRLNRKGN